MPFCTSLYTGSALLNAGTWSVSTMSVKLVQTTLVCQSASTVLGIRVTQCKQHVVLAHVQTNALHQPGATTFCQQQPNPTQLGTDVTGLWHGQRRYTYNTHTHTHACIKIKITASNAEMLPHSYLGTLSVLLSALCPPAPLKSLTFWRYTNQMNIITKQILHATVHSNNSHTSAKLCWYLQINQGNLRPTYTVYFL